VSFAPGLALYLCIFLPPEKGCLGDIHRQPPSSGDNLDSGRFLGFQGPVFRLLNEKPLGNGWDEGGEFFSPG
jgi:hypothetical protein